MGIPAARADSSASESGGIASSSLSAPSETTTIPDSGSPAISCCTRVSPAARFVRGPVKAISPAPSIRSASESNPYILSRKRSSSAFRSAPSPCCISNARPSSGSAVAGSMAVEPDTPGSAARGSAGGSAVPSPASSSAPPKRSSIRCARVSPFSSATRMLRESSSRTATKFRRGTTVETRSTGRSRRKASTPSAAARSPMRTQRSRASTVGPTRRYSSANQTMAPTPRKTSITPHHGAARERSPRSNTTGLYLKRNSNTRWPALLFPRTVAGAGPRRRARVPGRARRFQPTGCGLP